MAVNSSGSTTVNVPDMMEASAYNITVTPADSGDTVGIVTEGAWRALYEGEDADVFGGNARKAGASSLYACSGTGQAQYIDNSGDYVTFNVDVPEAGYYTFEMIYGAATGSNVSNMNSHNPLSAKQTLTVNGSETITMFLPSTLNWYMAGKHTEYIYLKAGANTLKITGMTSNTGKATLDCFYLTYSGSTSPEYEKTYEAELADFNVLGSQTGTTATTKSSITGYSGSGYVTGLNTSVKNGGGLRFIVYADQNGMYDAAVRYSSTGGGILNYYVDNTAKTLSNLRATVTLNSTSGGWQDSTKAVYLQKGINIIDIDTSTSEIAIDKLTLTHASDAGTEKIEAESCETVGTVETAENEFASGGKYIKGIRADADGANALIVNYNAAKAGAYKLAVYQSNKEIFGNHSYNAQLVDRHITVSVNDGDPFNVYFRNTYSDDSFKSQVIDVVLQAGENTIKIYNDDHRTVRRGEATSTSYTDGNVNVYTLDNYTPNLDYFEITYAALTDEKDLEIYGHSLTLDGTIGVNWYVYLPEAYRNTKTIMEFTYKDQVKEVPFDENAYQITDEDDTIYRFTFSVPAKEMTETITAQLVGADKMPLAAADNYTVKNYADQMLEIESNSSAAKAFAKALLNYGGYAQSYFKYNTGNLANKGIEKLPEFEVSELDVYNTSYGSENGTEKALWYGSSLILESQTTIRHYVTITDEVAAKKAYMEYDGKKIELTRHPTSKDIYYADIKNIAAQDLKKMYEVQICIEGGASISKTKTYGAYTYVYNTLRNSQDGDLKNLVKAICGYADATDLYLKELKGNK